MSDKSTRQPQLSLRMRRALIALQVQTPQPLVARLPVVWYYASMAVLLMLLALVSTRSALLYRAELHALEARVLYVQRNSEQQAQTRSAALIAFQQRPAPVLKTKEPPVLLAEADPETMGDSIATVAVNKKPMLEPVVTVPKKPRVSISSSLSKVAQPRSVEGALQRLRQGRDDVALRWLALRATALQKSPAWPVFVHLLSESQLAEQHYQLGVLLNVVSDSDQALHWLKLAMSKKADARYLRAYAIAADRQGQRSLAIDAYRQYLANPRAVDSAEIQLRLSALEAS